MRQSGVQYEKKAQVCGLDWLRGVGRGCEGEVKGVERSQAPKPPIGGGAGQGNKPQANAKRPNSRSATDCQGCSTRG